MTGQEQNRAQGGVSTAQVQASAPGRVGLLSLVRRQTRREEGQEWTEGAVLPGTVPGPHPSHPLGSAIPILCREPPPPSSFQYHASPRWPSTADP